MAAKQENIMGSGSYQEERQNFSRNYPVDKEQGRGSCLVLPGSQRWKNRSKQEEQRVSLLGHESPVSASTRLTAWTSDTADTEEFTDYFPEDPFNASRKKKNKEQSSSARGREQQPRAITPEALLQAPKPFERRRRRSYDGEREPDGVRGQEATVPPDSMLHGPNPSGRPRRKSFEGEEEPSGVRGQEAKLTKSKRSSKSKSKQQPSDDGAPMMRSFSEEGARKSSSSLRFVTPQEQAPPARQSSRRRNSSSPDNEQDDGGDKDDGRSPRLSLLPVSETSIPEGVEEASTTDGEESSNDRPMSMRSFGGNTGSSKPQSIDEYSPQDVREFRSSSTDIRKHMQGGGRTTSDSVSPPTPRMRKLPDESSARPKELLPSVQQMASKSHSSDDLKDMMPDLMPTPQSRYASSTGKGSSSRGRGKSYASSSALESPSNDTTDVNYIHALENVEALNAAAVENVEHGEYDAALASFEQVLSIYKGMHGEAHPLVASTYHNLGMVHSKRAALLLDGTFHQNHCRQQSLECFQAAARTGRDSLGPNHPNVAVSLVRIGFLLLQARQYQNAFVTFREALRIRLAHFGKETPHSLVANLYNNLGVCKMHLGQYKEGSSLLKTALEIQRKVLRLKRQEKDISRSELRNCLLEIADTLCNLGGLYLEWIRQQGPDPRNSTEAEAAFAEALEIRTTVLGPKHELVHQVRTLHEMARSTPLPAPLPDIDSQVGSPQRSRSRSRSMSVSLQEESGAESPQREIANENSNEQSDDRNKAFLHSSMLSDGSQTKAVSNVSTRDDTFASLPFVEVTVDSSMDQPSDEAESFARSPPSKVKDISHISADTQVRVAPHYIPRTTAPVAQPPSMNSGQPEKAGYLPSSLQRGSDQMAAHSNSQLMSGLRDLSLESAFERDGQNSSAYFAEESCLIGGIGGDNDRATSLFLSMLTHEDSYHADNSRTLSSHEIMVVRPMEGAGFDSPVQGRSKQMGSMASFSRALAQQKRASHRHELGEADDDETGKPYYDSPTMQLNGNGSMYAVSPKATPESDYVDNGDNGLAPLGGKWDSSRNLVKGKALTKEILDNPHDNLDRIYDAAGRYLKRNQYREALHLFQIILDCQRRQLGELHPDVGSAWHNVGVALLRSERHDKALEAFERAVRVRKGSLGKEHPEVAVSLVKVGITKLLLRDFEMALLSFRDALTVRRNSLGALHPSTARVYNNIGCVQMEFNELPEARRAFEAALDIQRNALSNEPTSGPLLFGTATTLCNLGYLYRIRDMPERAVLVLKEALTLQEQLLGPNHPTTMSTMDSLADVCAKSDDGPLALKYYGELLHRYRSVLRREEGNRKRSGTEAVLLFKMSRVHRSHKDFAAELSDLQKALQAIRSIDDSSMSSDERAEIDRLAVLISEDVKKCKTSLANNEFHWL